MDPIETTKPTPEDNGEAEAAALAAAEAASVDTPPPAEGDPFTKGVEAAREVEAREAGDPAPGQQDPPPADGEPPTPDPAAPVDPVPAHGPATPTEPDPVGDEINDLGITNERTQKRFRELSERAAETDNLRPLAERAQQWEETIRETGANPQQMGNALQYLAAINSGDPAAMSQALEFMQQEVSWLSKQLGRPAPGYDPLADHADLAQRVAAGELPRDIAEEAARTRRTSALQQEHQQRQRTASDQEQAQEQAQQTAMQEVATLGQQLRAADPQFDAKFKSIQPMVAFIQQSLPPAQWAQAIRTAYTTAAVAPAPPPPPAPPPTNPARASGVDLSKAPTKDNAFTFGVELARQQGR
ncbi:MAG: hypothetical protein IAE88_11610 [Rhodobacteraceae bacterium]|nr:hypothetical protein [Paracoccaceae bacterium]